MSSPMTPNKTISRTHALDFDICQCQHIVTKTRADASYAQNLYAALCNNEFQERDVWQVLANHRWSCSWRAASAIVADIRGHGNYSDWYCSGSFIWKEEDGHVPHGAELFYVPEGMITEEIQQDLAAIGWQAVD